MKVKNILVSLLLALAFIILYFNRDDTTFWLFGERTVSKIAISGFFYLLGVISGALLFRRRKKKRQEAEYVDITESHTDQSPELSEGSSSENSLSEEDRFFLGKD